MAARKICATKKCPEKTFGRLSDRQNSKRVDLCLNHFDLTLRYFGENVVIVDEWGVRPPPIENEEIDQIQEAINKAKENAGV